MNLEERELSFDEKLLSEIREKFWRIDMDGEGKQRLFFENAGGSLRLKSVTEISDELNKYPDCYAREHKDSKTLQRYEARGKEDLRILLNAGDGAIVTDLTASALMFKITGPMVEFGKGSNIVTSVLEHPSAYDACRYYADKFGKELRVAPSNRKTGGIDAEEVLKLVDKDTLMINVIAASNMTGAVTDLKKISEEARKINPDIFIVTDAVQHAPHGLIDTFFDYTDLADRDLILAMKLRNIGYYDAVREYEKRGIIVFERVAESAFSRRMVESFGLAGIIRVSPLHCNTFGEIDQFLNATKEISLL